MNLARLEELEKAAEEVLSKAEESEEIAAEDIAEDIEDEEEAEDEIEEDEEDEEEAEEEAADEVKKALASEILDAGAQTEVMTALVEIFSKSLADVMENVSESKDFSETSTEVLAKSLLAQNVVMNKQSAEVRKMQRMTKSIADKLEALEAKIDGISAQPAHMRKSVASYSVTDRNFEGSVGGQQDKKSTLSKAEITDILNNELASGSQIVKPSDIVAFESGAGLRSEVRALIDSRTGK